MTLPSSGQLAVSDVNNETGRGTTTQTGIDWIVANDKDGASDFNSLHGRTYYASTNNGACNNGNCSPQISSGNIQCRNCGQCNTINCTNCDTQPYLQPGNNCNCTYNCTQNTDQSYNCNCACNCNCFVCDCACW